MSPVLLALKYNWQFIGPSPCGEKLRLLNYPFTITAGGSPDGSAAAETDYSAVEVSGIRFEGDKLRELASDLKEMGDDDERFTAFVNRLGCCIMVATGDRYPQMLMRLKDCFSWSKYGLKSARPFINDDGETAVDVEGTIRAAAEVNKVLQNALDAKSVELVICKKELERITKIQSRWSELLGRKEVEAEEAKSRLSRFKAALGLLGR